MSSLVVSIHTLRNTVHTVTRTPRWFPDPWCRTSDKQPTPSGPTTFHHDGDIRRPRQTKTETVEDGDSRGRWQLETKTDSLWRRAKWQLPFSWRHPRVTKTELDTSLMQPADSRAHEGCSSLCSRRSSRWTAPVLSFPNLLSGKRMVTKRWQSPQVMPTGLTED